MTGERAEGGGVTPGGHGAAQQVANALAARVASGELAPGERLPPLRKLTEHYGVSANTASKAVQRLKNAGLLTGVAGGPTHVRVPPVHARRHNARYHEEKAHVLREPETRSGSGASEAISGIPVQNLYEQSVEFDVVAADEDLAVAVDLPVGTSLLRRTYFRRHAAGAGASRTVSHIPYYLVEGHDALLDPDNEPWPGGTQHQLWTIGIELDHIDDHVTASMPTRDEQRDYDIPPGVPVMRIRKISYDTEGRVVEVSDIPGPADRYELVFTTELARWSGNADD